ADHRDDLARIDLEVNAIQSDDARESLADPFHFQNRRQHRLEPLAAAKLVEFPGEFVNAVFLNDECGNKDLFGGRNHRSITVEQLRDQVNSLITKFVWLLHYRGIDRTFLDPL